MCGCLGHHVCHSHHLYPSLVITVQVSKMCALKILHSRKKKLKEVSSLNNHDVKPKSYNIIELSNESPVNTEPPREQRDPELGSYA